MGRHRLKWDRRRVILWGLCLCCFLYLYQNYEGVKLRLDDTEIKDILKDTPYLLRRTRENMTSEQTVTSRINDQRMWISRISRTEFIRNSPPKKIYVRDGLELYYHAKGGLKCPYAPEFTDKCQLTEESLGYRLLGSFKYIAIGVDAETVIRNWERRYTSQIPSDVVQIMHVMEPPIVAKSVEPEVNNAILADFSRFSDIPIPYSQWIPSSDDQTEVPFEVPLNRTKMVAAMISNCDSLDRLNYVKELQKHISVDVYGKCGEFTCPKDWNADCLKMIGDTYKFYLSFENSNCEDYITEKFFTNALKNNLLPIVMGAHPQDYKAAAPPGSYIHVNDFKTAEDLAKYLYKLNEDDEMYKAYFKWKRRGGSIISSGLEDFFCRVCGLLFYGDFVPRPIWSNNASAKDTLKCLPSGVYRWQ